MAPSWKATIVAELRADQPWPWRLKGMIDVKGHPVTSDFNVVRPHVSSCSIQAVWAILNSPVANAFAYSHSSKRHVLVGDMRKLPLYPLDGTSLQRIDAAVDAYFKAAQGTRPPAPQPAPRDSASDDQLALPFPAASRTTAPPLRKN